LQIAIPAQFTPHPSLTRFEVALFRATSQQAPKMAGVKFSRKGAKTQRTDTSLRLGAFA
jgi:hypothetical protein